MNINRRLGLTALLCGAAAPLAGSPYRHEGSAPDLEAIAQIVIEGSDHVDALTLAGWIRSRKPGLRVIDVRSPEEFQGFAIPSAENLPLDVLVKSSFAPDETLVLYSEGGAHAGQAWTLLRMKGIRNAWFIAGGLADWHDEVLAPVLSSNATPAQAKAFEAQAELSRYFGGTPSLGEREAPMHGRDRHGKASHSRRRGC